MPLAARVNVVKTVPLSKLAIEKTYRYYDIAKLKTKHTPLLIVPSTEVVSDIEEPTTDTLELEMCKYSASRVKGQHRVGVLANTDKKKLKQLGGGTKNQYELSIIFEKQNKKMGVRKLFFGKQGEPTLLTVDQEYTAAARNTYKKLLYDHPDFDIDVYKKFGRFFNRRFWHLNLCWNREINTQSTSPASAIRQLANQVELLEKL